MGGWADILTIAVRRGALLILSMLRVTRPRTSFMLSVNAPSQHTPCHTRTRPNSHHTPLLLLRQQVQPATLEQAAHRDQRRDEGPIGREVPPAELLEVPDKLQERVLAFLL